MAMAASSALDGHGPRQACAIVRALSGTRHQATPCIFSKGGSVVSGPPSVRLRWLEHFTDVL
eukprot:7173309-Pyramimonas_sp.AAC.1